MENKHAALGGLLSSMPPNTTGRFDDEIPAAMRPVDNRPPPSTPQVPRSNNRSVSGKDRSYRGLLQQKEARKLRSIVRVFFRLFLCCFTMLLTCLLISYFLFLFFQKLSA
jgi:hypothetical protein